MTSLVKLIGSLEERGNGPLYQRLQDALRTAIQTRALRPNEALPAERDLAEDLSISRITVRKALDGLVEEGLLTRKQGAGTFVASRVEKNFAKLTSFSEDMMARGMTVSSTWVSRTRAAVTPEEAMALGLSPGSAVYRFVRVRHANNSPMALEYSTLPGFALPSTNAVEGSLYAALEQSGHRPTRALQRLRAVHFTREQASFLDVQPGAAGLFIERRGFLRDGRPVELTQSYYRGDAYDFVAELNDE